MSWTMVNKDVAVQRAKKMARLVNCPDSSSKEMIQCLKTIKDPYELIGKDKEFTVSKLTLFI